MSTKWGCKKEFGLQMEFNITIPFIGLLIEKIEKMLFLKYFHNSHARYIKQLYERNWIPYDTYKISYKFYLENIKKNNLNDFSYFMIKNDSFTKIENIKLTVTSESIFCRYTQNIFIDELIVSYKPLVIYLNQIPFQELDFYEGHIIKKYDVLSVELISIGTESINKNIYNEHPAYNTFLNDKWKTKWGLNWNLQNIENGKINLIHYIYSKIAGKNISDIMIFKIDYHPRRFIKFLLYKMLTNKVSITILFWIFIWIGKIIEDENGTLIYRSI
ncbi:MAG: hypothetical protein Q7R95_01150 [bacterium]|nr:hypothetical protein [bacterium]